MFIRLGSSIVLVILLAIVLISGGDILFVFTLGISLIAFFEIIRAVRTTKKDKKISEFEIIGSLGVLSYYAILWRADSERYFMLAITMTIAVMMIVYVFTFPKYQAGEVFAAVFSFIYAPVMLSYIYLTRQLSGGKYLVWLIFASSWACDTCAYCVGMLFGKHKLAPILSPKKSIEGAVGGVAGAAAAGFAYAYVLRQGGFGSMPAEILWIFPLISALGAVLSQVGDLAASGIKRNMEIKDYGKLIPGHGGIMDRFDSVCMTAPLIYYLSFLFMQIK